MRALVVDLNNFSRYPTMAVGLLASILREAGIHVDVLSPFALGVESYPRRTRPGPWGLLDDGLRYWSDTTQTPFVDRIRKRIVRAIRPPNASNHRAILAGVRANLESKTDIILISAYTMYSELCKKICSLAALNDIPVLVGGNYFSEPEIVERWLGISGLSAVYAGEPEAILVDLVTSLVEKEDVYSIPGTSTPRRGLVSAAAPIQGLDGIPFPDYSDFPWHKYPNRIIPMMSGRGCGWGACKFCGDIVTSAGRRFRTRSPENVLDEMQHQHRRHSTRLFTFLDLKLNSNRAVWKALAERTQSVVPDAQWTASVHIDSRCNDDLELADLRAARAGGLIRMTTGLESGSPKILRAMAKGTDPERTSEVLHHAHEAGISIRLTVLMGYPGEEPDDLLATVGFLERHREIADRVVVNRLTIMLGSALDREFRRHPERYPQFLDARLNLQTATIDHRNTTFENKHHRRAVWKLLKVVHEINRMPLSDAAREFEGVM